MKEDCGVYASITLFINFILEGDSVEGRVRFRPRSILYVREVKGHIRFRPQPTGPRFVTRNEHGAVVEDICFGVAEDWNKVDLI
jgi:hypothetical protein